MENFDFAICAECSQTDICSHKGECKIVEDTFKQWINDHATDRDINRGGAV